MLRSCQKLLSFPVRKLYTKEKSDLIGTLHLRFFNYLKENKTTKCDDKLLKLIQAVEHIPPNKTSDKKYKQVDNECLKSIRKINHNDGSDEVYGIVDTLIQIVPHEIKYLRSFLEALDIMMKEFERNPDKETFVRLCFYLAQLKKNPPGPRILGSLIKQYIDRYIDDMNTIDVSIVATAAFKASVKVLNESFSQRLISEITNIRTFDSFIFITFVKSLRQNKINSPAVFENLRNLKNSSKLDGLHFSALVHTFMLIADNSIKDDNLTEFFIEKSVNAIENDTRVKDAQKLLYSCALLNNSMKSDHLQKLEHLVMTRTDHIEYEQKFDNYVDAALSMWMLNHRPKPLIMKLLNDKRFHQTGDKGRIKLDSRKKLLLTCIKIEEPHWTYHLNIVSPSFDAQRAAPRYLEKSSIERVKASLKFKDAKIVQQIKHLNIAGILLEERNGQQVHIEVLDNSNTLSDKKTPNGFLALKLRLLKQMGCKVRLENMVSR